MKGSLCGLVAVYQRLLRCYPASFRDTFAIEMEAVFCQVLTDAAHAGPFVLPAVIAREFGAVVITGLTMRLYAVRTALWGNRTPPETFSLTATLRGLGLTLGALLSLGLLVTLLLNIVLDATLPQTTTGPIERVIIGERHINGGDYLIVPAGALQCAVAPIEAGAAFHVCRAQIEGKTLQLSVPVAQADGRRIDSFACTVTYGDAPVPCKKGFSYGYGGAVTVLTIPDTLGISPARLAQLRQAQPLLYTTEATWVTFANGVALILAFLGAALLGKWFALQTTPLLMQGGVYLAAARMGRLVVGLGGGFIIFGWMWWWLLIMLLRLGLVD